MFIAIIACVLAIAVPAFVGLALHISWTNTLQRHRETYSERLSAMKAVLERLETGLKQTSATALAADLAALQGDVESLAKTVRKNFGRVWGELGVLTADNKQAADDKLPETPEEVRARLRLEHGLPTLGRRTNSGDAE